jgi:hypothetical protein
MLERAPVHHDLHQEVIERSSLLLIISMIMEIHDQTPTTHAIWSAMPGRRGILVTRLAAGAAGPQSLGAAPGASLTSPTEPI